ncbi:hemolysin family protein [Clostridium rectalis]|uniref:hemolysin family protein n=1 Tax=Clostridium rectalis TaxID=2040295 RepID=UPI000F63778A|nr:hemolysin family protein [Clostridium rectalis]
MPSNGNNLILEMVLILILIIINAFFAASEMAIVSLNKTKISYMAEEDNNAKAKLLLDITKETSKFLATIQVGITIAGFLASAFAATNLSIPLSNFLKSINVPAANQLSLIIVTVIISYITLVFGELLPKRMALQNSEKIALFVVKPIMYFSKITLPFVKILTYSTNVLVKLFGINVDNLDESISEEEIKMMIQVGEESGVINETEKEMIDSIFDFNDTLAKEIMTARTNVFSMDINTCLEEFLDKVLHEKYSRIPIYEEDIDNIIGVLYIKDLLWFLRDNSLTKNHLRELLRPAYFVPESKTIDTLFKEMQKNKSYISILIDEYGGFSGIVTMEDLLEEIVGNIFDEYDETNDYIKRLDSHTYIVDGLFPIDDFNDLFNQNLPSDHADTLSGFVTDLLGSIPKNNDEMTLEYNNIVFKLENVEDKRIKTIKVCIP